MNTVIIWITAICAVIGGLDYLFGNKLKLGEEFERCFQFLPSMAMSMAGIICIAPILADVLGKAVVPAFTAIGVDPAMFAGILALDLGGFQMAEALAIDPLVGRYAGIVVGAIVGCAVTFTIPVGMGLLDKEDKPLFSKGILFGLMSMPVGLLVGALASGMGLVQAIWQNVPLILLAILLIIGFVKNTDKMIRGFARFAAGIRFVTIIGLVAAIFIHLTGIDFLPRAEKLQEAMGVVASCWIVMLGSLPMSKILRTLLRKPLDWMAEKTGMNACSVAGLMLGLVGTLPVIAILRDMDDRGKVVSGAYLVCSSSMLAAHLGFTAGVAPEMVVPMIVSKLAGGCAGVLIALWATRKTKVHT